MEARNCATGNGNKQDWEQWLAIYLETNEGRHINLWVSYDNTDNTACNHAQQQEGAKIITRLHQQPHWQNRSNEAVAKDYITPAGHIQIQWEVHTHYKHESNQYQCHKEFYSTRWLELSNVLTKAHSHYNVQQGNGSCLSTRYIQLTSLGHTVKGIGNNIREGCNNQQCEKPAEQQEKSSTSLAYILLNQHAHGLALILYRSIKSRKILYSTEEYTAKEEPQQSWRPAKHGSNNRAGNRACTSYGRKLMGKYCKSGGRGIVLTILKFYGWSLGLWIYSPGLYQPAAVT